MLCPKCARAVSLEYGQTKCPHCGAEISPDVIAKIEGGLRPPSSEPSQSERPQPLSSSDRPSTPLWDNDGPFFTRLFNTWKETMFHPGRFFKSIPTDAGLGRPLLYAIIMGFIGMAGAAFWQIIFSVLQLSFLSLLGLPQNRQNVMLSSFFTPLILLCGLILSPLFITIGAFVSSGIFHLFLMIVGGNKKGFEATFRSLTYAYSPNVFSFIPFCGGYIALVWQIVIIIIGFKETHQIPTWKAIVACLLPLILCCVCGLVLVIIAGAAIFSAIQSTMPH